MPEQMEDDRQVWDWKGAGMKNTLIGNMKWFRQKNKLTQQQVADAVGIQRSTYSRYEEGTNRPSYLMLAQIADLYQISLDELVGRNISVEEKVEVSKTDGTTGTTENARTAPLDGLIEMDETAETEGLRPYELFQLYREATSYAKETAVLILANGRRKARSEARKRDTLE